MLNNVSIMGRLVRDPEFKHTENGVSVCRFSLAVGRNFMNRESGERETDFIDVSAWRGLAEFVDRNFEKGDSVVVEGELRSRNWTNRDGVKRHSVFVNARNVFFGTRRRGDIPEPDQDAGDIIPEPDQDMDDIGDAAGADFPDADEDMPF